MALDAVAASIRQASRRSYGRPRIVAQLRLQGERVGAERVRQSLQRQQLRSVYKRPFRIHFNILISALPSSSKMLIFR